MASSRKKKSNYSGVFKDVLVFILILALLVMSLIFMISKLVSQQATLPQQEKDKKYYAEQKQQLEEEKAELQNKLSKVDSNEYIESIVREKLNMYYPTETVYVDASTAP